MSTMLYVLLILLASHYTSVLTLAAPYYDLNNSMQYFEDFIQEYDKHYADEQEKKDRLKIFKENLIDVNRLNTESNTRRSGEASAVFGITQFMDLTAEDFNKRYFGVKYMSTDQSNCALFGDNDIPYVNAPEAFDWRDQGVVSRVKDQGDCGSCYAFSATGYLEAQVAIKKKQTVDLSEQQIVDCDEGSNGCATGSLPHAFVSIIERGGIMSEADYPYTGTYGVCRMDPSRVVVTVGSCNVYQLQSQEKLKQLLFGVGPISIEISGSNLRTYTGGVFNDQQCLGEINHYVLLVGYGTDPVYGPYWIIKNSYGPSFGEGGYIRVQRGDGAWSCGLMSTYMATASVV